VVCVFVAAAAAVVMDVALKEVVVEID